MVRVDEREGALRNLVSLHGIHSVHDDMAYVQGRSGIEGELPGRVECMGEEDALQVDTVCVLELQM